MRYLSVEQQRQRRMETAGASRPFISVIVPVRNEAAFIADTLQQLLEQRYDAARYEIIVADGRSTDDTRTIVAALQSRYAHLRLLDNPRQWSSAGRNAAIRTARGEIVLLIDGHCQLKNPYYLQSVAEAFAESGADCVGRPPSPLRGRRGWVITPPRTFTPAAPALCRPKAWPSPIAAASSTRSACSTNASTPAKTWSSIIVWHKLD
jgi:glycosyltransferase involved in cell wall biosynthesis